MIKELKISPAWDKRNVDPNKNYGIHGCEMRFMFGDSEKGVVQFLLFTNWHLPEVTEELLLSPYKPSGGNPHWMERPQPADLGYHSPTPRYEGQHKMDTCDCLSQGFCYYDGSGCNAERVYEVLLREGSDGVWRKLEEYYKELFL